MSITQEDIDRAQQALEHDEGLQKRLDDLDEALAKKIEERESESGSQPPPDEP
jgi:hypothetical protein